MPPRLTFSGGPLETVAEGVTGFLRPPEPRQWAEVIRQFIEDPSKAINMGKAARQRVESKFSREQHINQLEEAFYDIMKN